MLFPVIRQRESVVGELEVVRAVVEFVIVVPVRVVEPPEFTVIAVLAFWIAEPLMVSVPEQSMPFQVVSEVRMEFSMERVASDWISIWQYSPKTTTESEIVSMKGG